jgi:4-amino-4-deoxy-L-arabinose transferase-like glycosyltransferase
LDILVDNLVERDQFACRAPFAAATEETAHVAPGYPYFLSTLERLAGHRTDANELARWIQAGLGALTAGLYFLIALIAFRSRIVAVLAGFFCAVHPFWVANTATINDGVLATFLLALSLFLGTRGGIAGGALTSLLYGLTLAGLALVRAALLPFAIVGLLWFLLRSRDVQRGWLCGLVAFLGFVIGITPWTLRNWNLLHEIVPVVDSRYEHLWMGNNPRATGGPMNDEEMIKALAHGADDMEGIALQRRMAGQPSLEERHRILAEAMHRTLREDPAGCVRRRIGATLSFFFGESFIQHPENWVAGKLMSAPGQSEPLPPWLGDNIPVIFFGVTLGMLLLGALGWRWTFAWRKESRLLALATIFIPIPYILSHAEGLVGPRLPLDGVLLTFAAYALSCMIPGVGATLFPGPEAAVNEELLTRRPNEDKPYVRL